MHKILVVGGGSIGERHVRCILATKRAEVSLCELNADLRAEMEGKYELAEAFGDFDGAELGKFDGVVICTPANMHIKMARQVVGAGVNLFCEKPLTVQDEGVKELLVEIAKAGVVAGVAFTWRYMPWTREMVSQLESGAIGQLRHIGLRVGQHFPHYRPAYRDVYFNKPEMGGGAILDAASHMVNLAQLFGGKVASVSGMYCNSGLLDIQVEDTVDAMLLFAGGCRGSVHVNLWQRPMEIEMTLVGSQGSLRYSMDRQTVGLCKEINGNWEETHFQYERDDFYIAEANNFLNAIQGKENLLCSVTEAYETNQVCWAIRESFDEGRRIEIGD